MGATFTAACACVTLGAGGEGYSTTELQDRARRSLRPAGFHPQPAIARRHDRGHGLGRSIVSRPRSTPAADDRWSGGREFESDTGYAERMKEIIKLEDEHTKKLEAQAHQHRQIGEHLQREVITLNRRTAILNNPGMSGATRANLDAQAATESLTAELARPEMRDAKGRLTGNAADYRTARTREIEAQRRFDVAAAFREENASASRSGLAISDINARAHEAEMRAEGRGTEAGYTASRRAIQDRLTRLGIAYQAEGDPTRRAQLNQQYQAELLAGNREVGAMNLGMQRETTQDVRSCAAAREHRGPRRRGVRPTGQLVRADFRDRRTAAAPKRRGTGARKTRPSRRISTPAQPPTLRRARKRKPPSSPRTGGARSTRSPGTRSRRIRRFSQLRRTTGRRSFASSMRRRRGCASG
jgi:hypothetical protein